MFINQKKRRISKIREKRKISVKIIPEIKEESHVSLIQHS